jgi:hypothetical protein
MGVRDRRLYDEAMHCVVRMLSLVCVVRPGTLANAQPVGDDASGRAVSPAQTDPSARAEPTDGATAPTESGDPVAAPPAQMPRPPRWLAHITMHHGLGLATDSVDDMGASSPGFAFGFQAGVQYRVTSTMSVGAGLDLTFATHDSDASAGAKAKYLHYFPTAVGRLELGRFAVSSWAGFHVGSRAITEPGGLLGSDRTIVRGDVRGPVVAGAFVVRIAVPSPRPLTIELGPFAQLSYLAAGEGGGIGSLVLGLCSQVVFQGPPIGGDAF